MGLPQRECSRMIRAVNRYYHEGRETQFKAAPMVAIYNKIKSDIDAEKKRTSKQKLCTAPPMSRTY